MGIRGLNRALSLLERSVASDVLMRMRAAIPRKSLVILTYHRLVDSDTDLDEGVISATAKEFSQQLDLLARTQNVLTMNDLRRVLDGDLELPNNSVMITFDDGYRDNYELALPALVHYGLQATFFVTTGFVEAPQLPWWDRISYILKLTKVPRIRLEYPRPIHLRLSDAQERLHAKKTLLHLFKQVVGLDYVRFFAELEEQAQVFVDEPHLAKELFMNWEEVRRMHLSGMEIGAHCHSHRVLETIQSEEAIEELAYCQKLILENVGISPRSIAYPVGHSPVSRGSQLFSSLMQLGYDVGFTFLPGCVDTTTPFSSVDRYNLPRLPVARGPGNYFKTSLLVPKVAAYACE